MAKKRDSVIVNEFVHNLSETDLNWLSSRFTEQLSGDMPDVLNFLSEKPEMDRLLSSVESSDEFYYYYDMIKDAVIKEVNKHSLIPTKCCT